jgi:hypothetical protein
MTDNNDEITQLREQVRRLTERMYRIERQLGIETRIDAPSAAVSSSAPIGASPPSVAVEAGAAAGSEIPAAAARQQTQPASYGLLGARRNQKLSKAASVRAG